MCLCCVFVEFLCIDCVFVINTYVFFMYCVIIDRSVHSCIIMFEVKWFVVKVK